MGKPTGFLEYERALPADRPPLERLRDWREFHGSSAEDALRLQAARCMDCGTPFCHSGMLLAGMVSGCPLGNLMPEWQDLLYRGLWRQALERLLLANEFPEITGRVCPAPCEGACTLGLHAAPVTIRQNEYTLIERAFDAGWIHPQPPLRRSGKRVAVVGSGPAGLACAAELNRRGHAVTVYERADRPGGLLMYGIPPMKLDKRIVLRRVALLAAAGVRFETGREVGEDIPPGRLRAEFDAVVLCGGAGKPRDLPVEGRNLAGVHFALDFLRASTKSMLDSGFADGRFISAADKDVVVIGGGDTGTDCVATALRHGCRSVVQLEIQPEPPAERLPDNPWPQWPKVFRTDYGQEEARAVFGRDPREFAAMTTRLAGDGEGRVRAVHYVRVRWEEQPDGFAPVAIPGTAQVRPAQLVLLCLGFLGPEDSLPEQLGLARDEGSRIKTGRADYATSVPGVFAAGDMRRGQSLVVWALAEGRGAARAVDRYLRGGANHW